MVWELDEHERALRGSAGQVPDEESAVAPGKVTLTSRLVGRSSPIQRAAVGAAPVDRGQAQAVADDGIRGATGRLPYVEAIAKAFGRHDVGDVRVAVGGDAAAASRALGARAYATGDTIAFAEQPDLRLAAHEAAHVVQQRAGVQLDGGLNRGDDPYERHADRVADLVVRGESAEAALDEHPGGGGGGVQRSVQRFSAEQSPDERAAEARRALRELEPLGVEGRNRLMATWSPGYFDELLHAISPEDRQRYPVVIAAIEAARTRRTAPRGGRRGHGHGAAAPAGAAAPDAAAGDTGAATTTAGPTTATVDPTSAATAPTSAPAAPVDDATAWNRFATAFLELPAEVRALFPDPLIGAELAKIFTPAQRDKLTSFVASRAIPDDLFNGGDVARPPAQPQAATARQRILIAGHIMTTGTYANPGREQQRVEARMCGHFVTLINAYAGVGDANSHDVRGSTDARGDLVLFTGTAGHATTFEGDYFPVSRFDEIEAGDWLYIQGVDEGGHTMNHSVVFGGWQDLHPIPVAGAAPPPVEARNAVTYDQRHNGRGEGGIRHESTRLGTRPVYRPYVWGVTRIQPPEETNIATTADDLLPPGANLEGAAARNRAGLEASGLTVAVAMEHVRAANAAKIALINRDRAGGDHTSRLSAAQHALLVQANAATDPAHLENLVHLNERLQRLAHVVEVLEASDAEGAHAYSASAIGNEDTRAAGGVYTSAGRVARADFDNNDESATTGLLEHVEPALDGYSPAAPARRARRRGAHGGGGGASTPG